MKEMKTKFNLEFTVYEEQFVDSVGRKPVDEDEFLDWARLVEKGIDYQIDWSILFGCASDFLN